MMATRSYRPTIDRLEDRTLLTFLPPVGYDVDGVSYSVQTDDLNGDGFLDVALADYSNNGVRILNGNGNGQLGPPMFVPSGIRAYKLVIHDMNGDGVRDLVTSNVGSWPDPSDAGFSVILGNPDGTFLPARNFVIPGISVFGMAVGDFNNDTFPDVAVAAGSIYVFGGNGMGRFRFRGVYGTGYGVSTADLNGDGNLDLVTNLFGPNKMGVLLGHGNFSFQNPVEFFMLGPTGDPTIGEFNRDGILDLAVVTGYKGNSVVVLLGQGDGTFETADQHPTGSWPHAVVAADFNQDNKSDLVVTNYLGNTISLLLGNGDGSFQSGVTHFAGGGGPVGVDAADLNADGHTDIVLTRVDNHTIAVMLHDGGRTSDAQTKRKTDGDSFAIVRHTDGETDFQPPYAVTNENPNGGVAKKAGDRTLKRLSMMDEASLGETPHGLPPQSFSEI